MASLTTPVWGRPVPAESDVPDAAADMHALGLSLDTTPLFPTTATTSRTGVAGESVAVSPSQTLTLPASPVKGDILQVIALGTVTGATPTTVTGGGGKVINGVGLSAASSFVLGAPNSTATVQYDGAAWRVIAGQQDTGWITMSLANGWGAVAGSFTPGYRLRGDTLSLRGFLDNTSASSSTVTTFPTGFRPAGAVGFSVFENINNSTIISIATTGVLTCATTTPARLDGVSYPLTT